MKNFALLLALLLAAPMFAANNIKMVTYFPVPYASYNDLGVTGTCDVGLLDNCELDSGSSLKVFARGGDNGPLNTGTLTVKGGSLDLQSSALNSKISGVGLSAGRTGSIGTGTLEFKHDLEVNTMPDVIQSAEATNKAVLEKLKLINEDFPGCDAKDNEISWKRLTINDKSGVFLVCGLGEKAACTDSYGDWTTSSATTADTCNGNAEGEFACGNVAKECIDVKNIGGATFSFTADTLETFVSSSSVQDTCDGDKTARATASSCRKDGECRDIFLKSQNIYNARTVTCKQLTKDSYRQRTVKCCGTAAPNCDDPAYKVAHKSACCPSTPTSDTDCWYWDWRTYVSGGGDCSGGGCGGTSSTCVGPCKEGDTCDWTEAFFDTVEWGGGTCEAYPNGWTK